MQVSSSRTFEARISTNPRERLAREISVIAIDGPVAAGKTVVGRELARALGFG